MKRLSGSMPVPHNQHSLSHVVCPLNDAHVKDPSALLSFKTAVPSGAEQGPPKVKLKGTRGGFGGWLIRKITFKDPARLEEKTKGALNYLIAELDKHAHSLSPEIAQRGRLQLEDLLTRPLHKGIPLKEAADIFNDMLRRQGKKQRGAADLAQLAPESYARRFRKQHQTPPPLSTFQIPTVDEMVNNAKSLSDAYLDYAGKASRGDQDAGHKPDSPQAGALGQLANLLQVLQTATDRLDLRQAEQLQSMWENLTCPEDIEKAGKVFTPKSFSEHVQTLLQDCNDALQALQPALTRRDLDDARECCDGYAACFEQLVDDLTVLARDLLNALTDDHLTGGLPTQDKVFLHELAESLLATAYSLAGDNSPSMTIHQLLARDDAGLNTLFGHWISPPCPDYPPPPLPTLDRDPPASPRLPRFRQDTEPLRAPNGRLNKAAVQYQVVNGKKKLLKRLSTTAIPAIREYEKSLPNPKDSVIKPLSSRQRQGDTPRPQPLPSRTLRVDPVSDKDSLPGSDQKSTGETHIPLVPATKPKPSPTESDLDDYLSGMEQQQSLLPSASEGMNNTDPNRRKPTQPSQGAQETAPQKPKKSEEQKEDDLSELLEQLAQTQFNSQFVPVSPGQPRSVEAKALVKPNN